MFVVVCFLDPTLTLAQQVEILFHGVASILKCHLQFRTVLSPAINCWDKVGMVGNIILNITYMVTFSAPPPLPPPKKLEYKIPC